VRTDDNEVGTVHGHVRVIPGKSIAWRFGAEQRIPDGLVASWDIKYPP
jgi:hypothetical protein